MVRASTEMDGKKFGGGVPRSGHLWQKFFGLILVTLFALQLSPASADLVSPFGGETAPNFVEIRVLEDRVQVALEIDLKDYRLFVEGGMNDPEPLSARTGRTLSVVGDGRKIEPVTRLVDVRDRKPRISSARRVKLQGRREPSKRVVYAELDYAFDGRPAEITIKPPMESQGIPAASIGILVEHKGVPVTDYRYLSQSETLDLDWEDPWYSKFENPNFTRHHKSPLMSFISVEPREIRHEIIFRLRDLESWVDLGLGNSEQLSSADMEMVRQKAASFFAKHNPLRVDGESLSPSGSQVSQLSIGVSGLQILEDFKTTDRWTALLGIILSYPQAALPTDVEMVWDLFPGDVNAVPVTVTDPAGGVPNQATINDPIITWKNYLKEWVEPKTEPITLSDDRKFPYVEALLASLGFGNHLPDTGQAEGIMSVVLDNITAALRETQQAQFEKALEQFVAAESRSSVAAEIERGLSVKLPSGAHGRIDAIADLQIEEISEANNGAQVLANWAAEVSGGHWGHMHRRVIHYRGLFDLSQQDGRWTLRDLTVLSAQDAQS